MAAGYTNLDLEGQHFDTFPLLMDCAATSPADEHVVILNEHTASGDDPDRTDRNHSLNSSSDLRGDLAIPVGSLVRNSSSRPAIDPHSTSTPSLRMIPSLGRHSDINTYGNRQRTSPLNSGLWISIELTITLSQIIASVIVLFLSRDENPQAPLAVWVIGYAAGCLATLPLLYWRYANRFAPQSEQDSVPSSASLPPSPVNSPHASHSLALPSSGQSEEVEGHPPVRQTHGSVTMHMRMGMFMERFKIALDCFFAVWFVVGNVWIFGGHSSSTEAPNLYRLCIAFLTFSCIGYAMPFILCATICCCLPCIITLLGLRENQGQTKGASSETIDALPTYKFKSKGANRAKSNKDGNDSDSEGPGEGGFVAAGTERERAVLPEDAVCCICLGKYRDDDELRELPCTHFFHVECVDKWLKINASCPLCKHDITGKSTSEESTVETNEQSISLEVA